MKQANEIRQPDRSNDQDDHSSSSSSSLAESVASASHHTSTERSGHTFSAHSTSSSLSWVKMETVWVMRCRYFVLAVIAMAALTCGALTHRFVRHAEYEVFCHEVRVSPCLPDRSTVSNSKIA
jgi:hypothetical protein